jgi:3-dehydroquinate dehydratase/shikimate dehydrogenase
MGPSQEQALAQIEAARPFADVLEFRLDHFIFDDLSELVAHARPIPLIFTYRKASEGGARPNLTEADRQAHLKQALSWRPTYCDLEKDTDASLANTYPQVTWIRSHHDFEKTPLDLEGLVAEMHHPSFAITKLALKANRTVDMLRLMAFAWAQQEPLIAISLGPLGLPSRVIGPIVGSPIGYSSFEIHDWKPDFLMSWFHYRSLNRDTKIYALLGCPVDASVGDQFHNQWFQEHGINAVYVKLHIEPEELAEAIYWIRRLPFAGLSVTMPHKETIIPLLDALDPDARAIGAVNTVLFNAGKAIGYNTDGQGALAALGNKIYHFHLNGTQKGLIQSLGVKFLRGGYVLSNTNPPLRQFNRESFQFSPFGCASGGSGIGRVAILGAGGTARAIAHVCEKAGGAVRVYNRSRERAEEWTTWHPLEEVGDYDILINTIPLIDASPISPERIVPGSTVLDVVQKPPLTPLLKLAEERGARIVFGSRMFEAQAIEQQRIWGSRLQ